MPDNGKVSKRAVQILVISGSCCMPWLASLDNEAQNVVEKAAQEVQTEVQIKILPISNAMFGGAPKEILQRLKKEFDETGRMILPAVIVNGKHVCSSPMDYQAIKQAIAIEKKQSDFGRELL